MTAQSREIIYIDGKEERMAAEPLGFYLNNNPQFKFKFSNTACWRGYYGTWTLENDRLYLIELEGNIDGPDDSWNPVDLQYLFPGQEKVFANWFSDIIKIEKGDLLEYVHMGYASKYERNLFLVFEEGVKVDEYLIENN
ncbi:MAG: hypothetical protein ABJ092_14330 [Gillisia sp.]